MQAAAGGPGRHPQPHRAPRNRGLAYGIRGPTLPPTRLEAALDELEKDMILSGLLDEDLIGMSLRSSAWRSLKATEHSRDYTADDWTARADEFEVATLSCSSSRSDRGMRAVTEE